MVSLYKARRVTEDISDITIDISEPMPNHLSTDLIRLMFEADAKDLADAIFTSLPSGTIDCLLIEMLERKRSMLIVNR